MFKSLLSKSKKRIQPQPSEAELLEMLKLDIDKAVEALLVDTELLDKDEVKLSKLTAKLEMMRNSGLINTKQVLNQYKLVDEENSRLLSLRQARIYQKYPYRFIEEHALMNICAKYGLLVGPLACFTGEAPDWVYEKVSHFNQHRRDIISDEHLPHKTLQYTGLGYHDFSIGRFIVEEFSKSVKSDQENPANYVEHKDNLCLIAAPKTEMNTDNHKIVNGFMLQQTPKFQIKNDPLVLQPVKGGFLIIAAWGPEAFDPAVQNNKLN